ncbi:hypothetical protein ACCO45_003619 [Purpureocillium lilacinum]|uniref:Uncharacterized protein n=1 Tax=Purpureocillium lilacinum TaxID=33203 RepID=A0ACC4E364_PURLI
MSTPLRDGTDAVSPCRGLPDVASLKLQDARHVDDQRRAGDSPKPPTLDQLPTEIVEHILAAISETLPPPARHAWNTRQKAVQSLRLVCRRLHDLASPLLFPYISLSLDQESLDAVDRISRRPYLAAGVRGVMVDQTCRDGALVNGQRPFTDFKRALVEELRTYAADFHHDTHEFADDEGGHEEDKARARLGLRNFRVMCNAWRANYWIPDGDESDDLVSDAAEAQKYVDLLRRGRAAYARAFEKQVRLVSDGTFLRVLAAAFARMPRLDTVNVGGRRLRLYANCRDQHRVLTDDDELERFVESQAWSRPETPPNNMFVEVLLATHAAGRRLRHIYAEDARLGTHMAVARSDEGADEDIGEKLRAVSQALESVHLFFDERLDPAEASFVDDYASTVTSGRSFAPSSWKDTPDWPCLRKLHVYYAAVSQTDLEALCGGLRDGSLHNLLLVFVFLISGLWADVLDALRSKVSGGEGCTVRLLRPTGAEMRDLVKLHVIEDEATRSAWEAQGFARLEPIVTQRAEWYLAGDPRAPVNPFRGELDEEHCKLRH